MKSIEIESIKSFTTQLFAGTAFDSFLAVEASFSTAATFTIDGHVNEEFVGEEDMKRQDFQEGIVRWRNLRPICYEIIKGKKVPQQFKVVLKTSAEQTAAFLTSSGSRYTAEQINGLFLNINFRGNKLYCTTGTALKLFSMDKSLELLWDEYMTQFLRSFSA